MKVALVHDFLAEYGGAERVLEVLHQMYPEAPVYTAFVDWEGLGPHAVRLKDWDIRQSWAASWPGIKRLYSPLRVWSLNMFESFDLSEYEVVISSSNMYMAKGVVVKPGTVHLSYLHSVPKFLYGFTTARNWRQTWVGRWVAPVLNHKLRLTDYLASQRPDVLLANSETTKRRIAKYYRREAEVIYPPVVSGFTGQAGKKLELPNNYYLCVSRLVLAKHFELAVEAANREKFELVVVGRGPEGERLRAMAGETVRFMGEVTDEELAEIYQRAKAFIYPVEDEDFGMVAVEAMGYGVPVVGYNSGGVRETVEDGLTGVLFDELSVEGVMGAVQRLKKTKIIRQACRQRANKFSRREFERKIKQVVARAVQTEGGA